MTTTIVDSRPAAAESFRSTVRWLPLVLQADAAVAGGNGLAYLLAAAPLGRLLGLPTGVLVAGGAFLIAYAAVVWMVARRRPPARAAVVTVVCTNVVWAADSVAVVAAGWFSPTTAGQVWILLQAAAVTCLAFLQWQAVRSAATPAPDSC